MLGVREGHAEECFRIADELVDVAFPGYFLHDTLLVVVAQGPTEFVIVHRGSVLLDAPTSRYLQDTEAKIKACLKLSTN